MAPLGAMFTDDQFAEVITYVRSAFGNTAAAVTVDQAKAWREKYDGKPMWTRAKLDELNERSRSRVRNSKPGFTVYSASSKNASIVSCASLRSAAASKGSPSAISSARSKCRS